MDRANGLAYFKVLVPGQEESTYETYYQIAELEVLSRLYPFSSNAAEKEVPTHLLGVTARIAEYLLDKQGASGQLTHSENGISRSYESGDIPHSLTRTIIPYAYVLGENDESDDTE